MNELQVQLTPLSALVPYAKNARTHSDESGFADCSVD